MKKIIVVLVFLISGFAFAQTTVTLEDQCNCEVLSGVDVTAPGMTSPAGADTGDIYVNTNTGTIYFWDGDSWELTSSDDQNLQNFTFDSGTNTLSLDIENGNTVTADLSALDQAASDVDYDNTTSGLTATDVQAAIDEINAAAGTVALVDNGDGTYDFTDAGGTTTTITDTSISTLSTPVNGVYTYTDESGATQTIDTNASSNPYDNTTSGLTATDVQAAIDEVVSNSSDDQDISTDGTSGNISIEDGSTLTLNVDDDDAIIGNEVVNGTDATLTRSGTGTTGDPYTLDVSADGITNAEIADNAVQLENVADGTTVGQIMQWNGTDWVLVDGAGLSTDDQQLNDLGTTFNAGTNELTIALEDGGTATADLSALDNAGTDDQTATEVTYDNTTSGLTAVDTQAAIDELAAGSTDDQNIAGSSLAGNTLTIGIENGNSQDVDLSSIANTDNQQISLSGNILTLDNGTGADSTVDLAPFRDDQNLSSAVVTANESVEIQIDNGTNTTIDIRDADADPTNEIEIPTGGNSGQILSTDGTGVYSWIDNDSGPQGPQGVPGNDGADGADGAPGAQGPQGVPGNDGADGADGAPGAQGPQGVPGNDGADGADGAQGPQGVPGNDGADGADGAPGAQGPQGVPGNDGADGADGAPGAQGPQGVPGNDGADGAPGADGADGAQGPQGVPGNDGADGADGAQGPQGIPGNDGADGADGAPGAQGPPGDPATDDQTLSTDGTPGDISISGGNNITLNVNDADSSVTNEVNTAFNVASGNLNITDSDGTLSVPLTSLGTDDQFDDEVPLRTPIDVDEGGIGSPTLETNVEEVIQAIAPITSKAARIFYPPSIAIDASSTGDNRTVDLYQEYLDQFGTPTASSGGAPSAIPTYGRTELYYYVTYADPTVFDTAPAEFTISAGGVLTYDIIATPADYNSLINVVFVVK
mgnify:CR=1 FL=1